MCLSYRNTPRQGLLAACTVGRATMPPMGRNELTSSLHRFKKQFWQWYCVDSFSLAQVTELFLWLFVMLARIEGTGERVFPQLHCAFHGYLRMRTLTESYSIEYQVL